MKNYDELIDYAKSGISIEEICIILEMTESEFWENYFKDSNFKNAFNSGRLQTKTVINTALFELAKNGSQPAINEALKIISQMEKSDKIRLEEAEAFYQNGDDEYNDDEYDNFEEI